jgi:hypothetical protein
VVETPKNAFFNIRSHFYVDPKNKNPRLNADAGYLTRGSGFSHAKNAARAK